MLLQILKSKIHRARVTQAELGYMGSVTIDAALMEAAHLYEGEQVHIVNISNGARLITYAIAGERNSGVICMNGAAARMTQVGDLIIIIAYGIMSEEEAMAHKPWIVLPDSSSNRIVTK